MIGNPRNPLQQRFFVKGRNFSVGPFSNRDDAEWYKNVVAAHEIRDRLEIVNESPFSQISDSPGALPGA